MTITETQWNEILDVSQLLFDLAGGINDAVVRLIRVLGELISTADPNQFRQDVSGCERKRDSAQPVTERRNHELN